MITINRIRNRWVHAKVRIEVRLAVARANRIKARTLRAPNPGYDELGNPLFIGVMVLATLVLLVDMVDGWQPLVAFILALGEWARSGA